MKHIDFMEKEYIRFFEHVDRFDFTKNKQITKFLKWCCNNRFFDNMSNDDFLYFYENTEQLCLPLLKHNDITIGIDYLCGIDPNTSKDIKFCDIPNIHAVRSSFEAVFNTVSYNQGINPQSSDFNVISNLFNTFWYDTIILILKSSFNIYSIQIKR